MQTLSIGRVLDAIFFFFSPSILIPIAIYYSGLKNLYRYSAFRFESKMLNLRYDGQGNEAYEDFFFEEKNFHEK